MNKGIILRASLILGTFLIIIAVAVGCEMFDKKSVQAQITNPDGVYLSVDGVEITRDELWTVMRNVDGMKYLYDYVDGILLKEYIDEIDQSDIDAEISLLTYNTDDQEQIDQIQAEADINQRFIDSFNNNLIILGFDPEDALSVKDYAKLSIARRAVAIDMIETETDTESRFYLKADEIESYYDSITYGDACTLDLRFQSTTEAENAFLQYNVVLNYEGGLGQYVGSTDISLILKADFDDTNTNEMNDEQAFLTYLKVYNYMNPWSDAIPETTTKEAYCTTYADLAVKNYTDLTDNKNADNPNFLFADYIFNDLVLDDAVVKPYTFSTNKSFADYVVMSYKVSEVDTIAFEDLNATELEIVTTDFVLAAVSEELIADAMSELYADNGFELFDKYLKLDYTYATGELFDNEGSETLVASLTGFSVTADQLFNYMEARIGMFYSVEVAKIEIQVASDAYDAVYGSNRDYLDNGSDKMTEHREALRTMKSNFSSNNFASYGYPSTSMSWDEFLFLAFDLTSEQNVMEAMYVSQELQFNFLKGDIKYVTAIDYMQDQIDGYFSLNIDHILVYADFDFDFAPDDFSDFEDAMTVQEATDFNALKLALEAAITDKLEEDDMTFALLIKEYTETSIDDDTSEWAQFKAAGLFIMTETLGEVDQTSVDALDDTFGEALKRIYDVYNTDTYKDDAKYLDDQLTVSDFGIHFISAVKGLTFEMPTAEFTYDGDEADYSANVDNVNVLPTAEQVAVYIQIKEDEVNKINSEEALPANVYDAVEYYYGPVYTAYTNTTGFSISFINFMLENNVVYTVDGAEVTLELEELLAVFYDINYPELFAKDAQ